MPARKKDRTILRDLGLQVAEIAALPAQAETISLWKALNGLKPSRPMVLIDQLPWHEMDVEGELALLSEDEFARGIETTLRRTLYSWRHIRADMVVEPFIDIPKIIRNNGWGIERVERKAAIDPLNDVVGHLYFDQLGTDEDVERIRTPTLSLDAESTAEAGERARELLDGAIAVRMQGMFPGFAPWDLIVTWRGAENLLLDLAARPEFMRRMISRLTDAELGMLDQLEEKGLLGSGQRTVHCTGAHTDELPAAGFDPAHPRARDMWTFGMAQIFSSVSPAMHKELEIDFAARWYSRFGLGYYGCCEPLHEKIDIIRSIPRVRKISMSPWVDVEKGAERIGRDFVFSRKPSPASLAVDSWNPGAVQKDLRDTRDRCARHGCPLEFMLKDISTVRYKPQKLWEWADIAMRVARK